MELITRPETTIFLPQPPDLTQYVPDIDRPKELETAITFATVGVNQVITGPNDPPPRRTFKVFPLYQKKGPLIIYDKRWYFRLVPKANEWRRARALLEDFTLNQIVGHVVLCFTPDTIPGRDTPFRNPEGKHIRIYALFDSYLEVYDYMNKFPFEQRAFYEIIFGEFPQKPHFDIDIDEADFNQLYSGEDINRVGEILQQAVVTGSIDVLAQNMVMLDLTRDLLLYTSHGSGKRSYHVLINNRCHDGNKEAGAFYQAVKGKVSEITGGKYLEFLDKSVYGPRQQFRLNGAQKPGSNRPKIFHEQFMYAGTLYVHVYNEDVTDPMMKALAILYESMVSFTSGCSFLPSLIPPKQGFQTDLGQLPDIEETTIHQCISMLRNIMPHCPFELKEIKGHLIILKRLVPSFCPLCHKTHEHENSFIYIIGGKVVWDCRRAGDQVKKLFLGYLAMTWEEMQEGAILPAMMTEGDTVDDGGGEFMFGDYDIGAPTLPPTKRPESPKTEVKHPAILPPKRTDETGVEGLPQLPIIQLEQRRHNVNSILNTARQWAQQKVARREANVFGAATSQMPWGQLINR